MSPWCGRHLTEYLEGDRCPDCEIAELREKIEAVKLWLKKHSVEKSDYVMGLATELKRKLE